MQYLQQQHTNDKGMVNMTSTQPPPPAMSLRARENDSMALKHIFDQINNTYTSSITAATRGGDDRRSSQGPQMGGLQGMRNQSLPDLRKRLPDLQLDLSFRKAQDGQEHATSGMAAQTAFGSPISTPTATSESSYQASLPSSSSWSPINSQLQPSFLPQAAAISSRPNPSSRQSTAQLTIFYCGNVNVYDDVPADKAQAIMLLAGNSWSSNFYKSPALPVEKETAPLRVRACVSPAPPSSNITTANNMASSALRGLSSPAPSPSLATASLPAMTPRPLEAKPQGAAKRPLAGIELPHARKASIARFLEKRKDRVHEQQVDPEVQEEKGAGEPNSSSGGPSSSPTSSYRSKKQCISASAAARSSPFSSKAINSEQSNAPHINEHRFLGY